MKTPIQNEGAAMKIPMKLFGSFRPADWAEEDYISHPPFVAHAFQGSCSWCPEIQGWMRRSDPLPRC